MAFAYLDCNRVRIGGPGQCLPPRPRVRAVRETPAKYSGRAGKDHRTGQRSGRDRERDCRRRPGLQQDRCGGPMIDRTEQVNLNDLFEPMTNEELEAYAQDGTLPQWFEASAG